MLGAQPRPVRPFALSLSSDGFSIASEALRGLAGEHAFEGVTFVPLQNRYAVTKLRRQVVYSAIESISLGQAGWCETCESVAKSLVRPEPRTVSAAEGLIGAWELVQLRTRFGTGLLPGEICWTTLHADLIVADGVREVLERARLKGLDFIEVRLGG